ncbi:unnamed protein product, partial [Vitis vinifera]|uniref:Uncharacterized protein n=1 Tax=Vitis vinifera TaxID=29760 RepID=D7T3S5_VITVI
MLGYNFEFLYVCSSFCRFHDENVFLYSWLMSFDILGVSQRSQSGLCILLWNIYEERKNIYTTLNCFSNCNLHVSSSTHFSSLSFASLRAPVSLAA